MLRTAEEAEQRYLRATPLYISTVTLAGLRFGIELLSDLTIVTRDRGDFERARVPLVNPWDAA